MPKRLFSTCSLFLFFYWRRCLLFFFFSGGITLFFRRTTATTLKSVENCLITVLLTNITYLQLPLKTKWKIKHATMKTMLRVSEGDPTWIWSVCITWNIFRLFSQCFGEKFRPKCFAQTFRAKCLGQTLADVWSEHYLNNFLENQFYVRCKGPFKVRR